MFVNYNYAELNENFSAETMLRSFLHYDNQVTDCLELLQQCLQYRDLLMIFEMTTESSGIDVPILMALMKGKNTLLLLSVVCTFLLNCDRQSRIYLYY